MSSNISNTSILSTFSTFKYTPISYLLLSFTILSTFITSFTSNNRIISFGLNVYPYLIEKYQYYRLITSQLIVNNPIELIISIVLLYQFKIFEKLYGKKKFIACILFYSSISMVLQLVTLVLYPSIRFISPGPYSIIFGLFINYRFDIPAISKYYFFGIPFTNKLFNYLLGLQLLFSNYPSSFIPGMYGIVVGLLYRIDILQNLCVLPLFITNIVTRISNMMNINSTSSHSYAPVSTQIEMNSRNDEDETTSSSDNAVIINNEMFTMLVNMGFTETDVRNALIITNNNPDAAMNLLLDSH